MPYRNLEIYKHLKGIISIDFQKKTSIFSENLEFHEQSVTKKFNLQTCGIFVACGTDTFIKKKSDLLQFKRCCECRELSL